MAITKKGDEVVLATAKGMAIRFNEADARPMGRNTSGVKGITLTKGDTLVGMVVADPDATLLTACANGYGKRTPFGPNAHSRGRGRSTTKPAKPSQLRTVEAEDPNRAKNRPTKPAARSATARSTAAARACATSRPPTATARWSTSCRVDDNDELMMMTARGKIQRVKASDFNVIGRNTQGVRIMTLDEGDTLTAVVRVPQEEDSGRCTAEVVTECI